MSLEFEWQENYNNVFTEEERSWIDKLLSSQLDEWHPDSKQLTLEETKHQESIKAKIKDYFYKKSSKCSYCNTLLQDRNIETDREHIVPKKYRRILTYNLFNLTLACKRCNMTYKKQTLNHISPTVVSSIENNNHLYDKDSYLIPHPNIEPIFGVGCHIRHQQYQEDDISFVSYQYITPKGEYLYNLVRLDELEIDTLDESQGQITVPNYLESFK